MDFRTRLERRSLEELVALHIATADRARREPEFEDMVETIAQVMHERFQEAA